MERGRLICWTLEDEGGGWREGAGAQPDGREVRWKERAEVFIASSSIGTPIVEQDTIGSPSQDSWSMYVRTPC